MESYSAEVSPSLPALVLTVVTCSFSETHAKIRFKYYDGLNGNLRAISPVLSLTLINQVHFLLPRVYQSITSLLFQKRRRASEVQQGSLTSQNEQDAEKFLNITIKGEICQQRVLVSVSFVVVTETWPEEHQESKSS